MTTDMDKATTDRINQVREFMLGGEYTKAEALTRYATLTGPEQSEWESAIAAEMNENHGTTDISKTDVCEAFAYKFEFVDDGFDADGAFANIGYHIDSINKYAADLLANSDHPAMQGHVRSILAVTRALSEIAKGAQSDTL